MQSAFCGNFKCMKRADFACGRCQSEHYCSKKCQVAAFASHRIHCFELPPLIENSEVRAEINDSGVDLADASKLTRSNSDSVKVKKTENNVHEKEEKVENVPEEDPVKDSVKVPFDAGKRSEAPNSYKLSVKTVQTPVNEFVVQELNPKKSSSSVATSININNLRRNHQAIPKVQPPVIITEPTRVFHKDLVVAPLPTGKFKAILLAGEVETKIFKVREHSQDAENHLAEIQQTVASFIAKQDVVKMYRPQKDEVVLAKFEGVFYRAICKSHDDDGYLVYFIDYGNSSTVTEVDLKPLDKSLMFDVIVHSCYFENLPDEVTQKMADVLSQDYVQLEAAKIQPGTSIYIVCVVGL